MSQSNRFPGRGFDFASGFFSGRNDGFFDFCDARGRDESSRGVGNVGVVVEHVRAVERG